MPGDIFAMQSDSKPDNTRLLNALRHPMRQSILLLMHAHEAVSPKELAAEMNVPLSNVAYHVRALTKCDAIVLAGEQPVRGTVQHFYRFNIDAEWALKALGIETG